MAAKTPKQTTKSKLTGVVTTAYIICAGFTTALILHHYSMHITLLPAASFKREIFLAFGQLIFQGALLRPINAKKLIDYFTTLMSISLGGAILLLPALIVLHYTTLSQTAIIGWFGLVAALMFVYHYQQVKKFELPSYLCFTWLLYRGLALILLLNI